MSTLSPCEQNQLDFTMDAQLAAHQTALVAAIEAGKCLSCGYHLKTEIRDKLLTFYCGDPECNWKAMYPIETTGTANANYGRGYREGFKMGLLVMQSRSWSRYHERADNP